MPRSYQRQRHSLIEDQSRFILRLQKALGQMNVKLTEVLRGITGVTGRRRQKNDPAFDARQRLYEVAGVGLTAIGGIEANTALVVLGEVGTDMSRWRSAKAFGSWLGLAPDPRKTGGRLKSARTRPGVNRAAHALRLAAQNLRRSQSAPGAFFRRVAPGVGCPRR